MSKRCERVADEPSNEACTDTGRATKNNSPITAAPCHVKQPVPNIGEHAAYHQHHRDFRDSLEFYREAEHPFRDKRMRSIGIGGGGANVLGIDHTHRFMRRLVTAGLLLDAPHREARREHGQERIRMDQFGDAIRERDQAQRIKTFGSESQAMASAQPRNQPYREVSQQPAHGQRTGDTPEGIAGEMPAQRLLGRYLIVAYRDSQQRKRQRNAVVQTAFAGEREAQQVDIAGNLHLHVMGEHGIGGGEHRGDQ